MGYVVKKLHDSKKIAGSKGKKRTTRIRPDGTPQWRVVFHDRRAERPENVPAEQVIPKDRYSDFGLDDRFTFDQAREVVKHLNSAEHLRKKNERARVKKLAVDQHENIVESAFLPRHLVIQFQEKVLIKRFADNEKQARYQRLLFHWKFAQTMLSELQIEPKDYADEATVFYRYFEKKEISPSYVIKILRIVNAWGQFYAKAMGAWGIQPISNPRGLRREKIARANQDKDDYTGPAEPLTSQALETGKKELLDQNYNWLYLSVWLGLRPEEIDNLLAPKMHKYGLSEDDKTTILWIFQTKLTSVSRDKAWKPIPLFLPEQHKCISIIDSKNFRRPLNKTLRKVFHDERITGYSGRKGFTDLMLSKGQELTEISVWLGHTTIETTWKHYKQKQVVRFKKAS